MNKRRIKVSPIILAGLLIFVCTGLLIGSMYYYEHLRFEEDTRIVPTVIEDL